MKTKKASNKTHGYVKDLCDNIVKYKMLYLMVLPVLAYYIIFCYQPMYGAQIAFRDFSPGLGITESPWVGFKHFQDFFSSIYFTRLIRNTFLLSFYNLVFGFPAPIILALLLNEVSNKWVKRGVQSLTYLPHFVSTMIICGIILNFVGTNGIITQLLGAFGVPQQNLLMNPANFRTIYIVSDIWQGVGWGSIIYIASLTSINPELYESAKIDGANKFQQLLHVTLPGITPTMVTMLILRMGSIMSVGYEKVLLLYNPAIYETSDIISTFVYRKGLLDLNYSMSTAVGLFNSVINLALLILANYICRKLSDNSLW